MDISIIIPNYNGAKLLEKNIPRLVKVLEKYSADKKIKTEIIIVDDASSDFSKEVIERLLQKYNASSISIRSILKPHNSGFSPTVNIGAKEANGEFLILLNSDAYPEDDFISASLVHFSDPEVFAVGFMDKSIEKDKVVLRGRGIGRWRRGFLIHERGEVNVSDTLWVNGGSGMYRKEIWGKLGGLIELYAPYYWEDIDISYRAQKWGYKILFEKGSVVVHEHEEGAIKKTQSRNKVQTIAFRNQFFFAWLNISQTDLLISHIGWLPYHFIKTLLSGDTTFTAGFFKALMRITSVMSERSKVQRRTKKSDVFVTRLYSH